jgi:tRNA pseudouridine-54 N-methylase
MVEALTLDEVVEIYKVRKIDLMKIDVEGCEIEVLKGGERALQLVEKIVLECHSEELKRQVKAFLESKGFEEVLEKRLEETYLLYFKTKGGQR